LTSPIYQAWPGRSFWSSSSWQTTEIRCSWNPKIRTGTIGNTTTRSSRNACEVCSRGVVHLRWQGVAHLKNRKNKPSKSLELVRDYRCELYNQDRWHRGLVFESSARYNSYFGLTKSLAFKLANAHLVTCSLQIGVGKGFPSPPSEPCWRFSRTRLSSRWSLRWDRIARSGWSKQAVQASDHFFSLRLRLAHCEQPFSPK
jgi:hypothetical protein